MKLIDILVEELPKRGGWPEDVCEISTHASGRVFFDGRFAPRGFSLPMASDAWNKYKHPHSYTNAVTREQYEAALAAKNDGWIEWAGGECPLENGTKVDVKDRDGYKHLGEIIGYTNNVDNIFWQHGVCSYPDNEIIAYRLNQPQEAVQAKADDEADLNECIGQDAAPVWNREGLPPVGVECEYSLNGGKTWWNCKIDYIVGTQGVVMLCDTFEGVQYLQFSSYGNALKFRPIHSEADRKRDEAVKTIMLTGWCQSAAEEIYDLVAAGKVPGMKLED